MGSVQVVCGVPRGSGTCHEACDLGTRASRVLPSSHGGESERALWCSQCVPCYGWHTALPAAPLCHGTSISGRRAAGVRNSQQPRDFLPQTLGLWQANSCNGGCSVPRPLGTIS